MHFLIFFMAFKPQPYIIAIICIIILIFSASKSWSVNDQKEFGGILDIEWWCNEVL